MSRSRSVVRRRDEAAVSNVLGAILMFGLLVLTLVVVQVKFVPVWSEDREARQMQSLTDDLSNLKGDLDRQAGNDTATVLSESLALSSAGGFRFFQADDGGFGTTATFQPSPTGVGLQVSTTKPVQILRRDGEDLFGLATAWPSYVTTDIANVGQLSYLRLRVDMNPIPSDGTNIRLNVYGAADNANPLGWVIVTALDNPPPPALYLQVFNAAGAEVSSSSEAYFQQTQIDYKYFDLLDPELLFRQVMQSGQAPYRLQLIQTGMTAQYQIAYSDFDSGGLAGATGILDPAGYSATTPSGRIEVDAQNQHFVDQTYVLEHGAIVLQQGSVSQAVMLVPPAIEVGNSALSGSIEWTVSAMTGDGLLVGGKRATVTATPVGAPIDIWMQSPQFSFVIPTARATAWAAYFADMLAANGWTASQYTLTTTSAGLTVFLEGPIANDPSCTSAATATCVYDVLVRFRASPIDIGLSPGG